jgi:hypothetical protein
MRGITTISMRRLRARASAVPLLSTVSNSE